MTQTLLISQTPDGFVWIAALENGVLQNLEGDHPDRVFRLHSVYDGKAIHKSHGIAWVELIKDQPPSPLKREKNAPDLPNVGQSVRVQITREAFPDKPPSITQRLSPLRPSIHTYLMQAFDEAIYDSSTLLAQAQSLAPALASRMRLASLTEQPLLHHFGVDEEIETCRHSIVQGPGGISLIFETTACAVTIDVNAPIMNQKEANLLIAPLLIKHLKWRDLCGNIMIDFIDAGVSPQQRQALVELLQEGLEKDWKILGWSRLGFLEVHRPKKRLPLFMRGSK